MNFLYPLKFVGYTGTAILYEDRVEMKKSLGQKVGGALDSIVGFEEMADPISKRPTMWVNGWVYLPTNSDPRHLRYWSDPPKLQIGRNPQVIVFTWFHRKMQERYIAAVHEARGRFLRNYAGD